MDVKYIPSEWERTKKGIGDLIGLGAWGKGMIDNLKDISDLLEDAQSDIAKYDSDGVISFTHTDRKSQYQQLYEDYLVLHRFSGRVGDIVDRTIDEPFYQDIDAFVEAMRDLSISEIKTKNRIGAKETIFVPGTYGTQETIEVPKAEVGLEDLFSGSNYYARLMEREYASWKELNPQQDFSEQEYIQAALNSRAFQYESIKDGQMNKEFWGQIAALVVIVGASFICPPAGMALGMAYGTLELSSAVSGKDWISGRELGTGERVFRGALAPLDIVPGVSALSRFSSAARFSPLREASDLQLLTGLKTDFQQKSQRACDMVVHAEKDIVARIRNAKAWAKEVTARLKNRADDSAVKASRAEENAVKNERDIISERKMGLPGEEEDKVNIPDSFAKLMNEEDAKRYQQFWDNVNAGIDVNNRVILSCSNGFAKQIIKQLKKFNITIEQFNKMKVKPIYEMDEKELIFMKNIRDSVPKVNQDTLLQKTFPASDIEKYLNGEYKEIGGYFAKAEDVSHIKDYAHVVESLRLDYSYVNDDRVVRPFPENRNSYGKILFKTEHIGSIEIPYGKRMGGTVFDEPPCTQNGFTASRNGEIVPEWKFKGYFAPKDGAELYEVINGKEFLRAIYDEDVGRFVPIQ